MGDIVTLKFNQRKTLQTYKKTLTQLKYFSKSFLSSNECFVDRDYDSFKEILRILRSGNSEIEVDAYTEWEWNFLNENISPSQEDILNLNIGGEKFSTSKYTVFQTESILKSQVLRWKSKEDIFLDMDPDVFTHILSLLRNPLYPFPSKYKQELDYFGISLPKEDNSISFSNRDEELKDLDTNRIGGVQVLAAAAVFGKRCKMMRQEYKNYKYFWSSYSNEIPNTFETPNTERAIHFRLHNNCEMISQLFIVFNLTTLRLKRKDFDLKHLPYILINKISLEWGGNVIDSMERDALYLMMRLYYEEEYQNNNYLILPIKFHCFQSQSPLINTLLENYILTVELSGDVFLKDIILDMKGTIDVYGKCILYGYNDDRKKLALTKKIVPMYEYMKMFTIPIVDGEGVSKFYPSKVACQFVLVIRDTTQNNYFWYGDRGEEDPLISAKIYTSNVELLCITPLQSYMDQVSTNTKIPKIPIYTHTFGMTSIGDDIDKHTSEVDLGSLNELKIHIKTKIKTGEAKLWVISKNLLRYSDMCVTKVFSI